jgi:D-alanyl-D-alanine carboxypeptidase
MHIPSIRYGRRVTQNFNKLIGRFPGADGFKTGFICASGYNLVASATRNGKRLIAVVLGASSGQMRAVRAAQLLERGFANNNLTWLRPALGTVDNLAPIDASPPNLRDEMCGGKRKRPASDEDEDTVASNSGGPSSGETAITFFTAGLQQPALRPSEMLAAAPAASEPVIVYTGPTKTGPALIAAAVDAEKQTPRRAKKDRTAGKKPVATADAKTDPKAEAKDAKSDGKPGAKSGARHASAKPEAAAAKPADKPAAAAAKPASRPAKPKAATKPAPKNSTTGEAKPAAGQKTAAAPRT